MTRTVRIQSDITAGGRGRGLLELAYLSGTAVQLFECTRRARAGLPGQVCARFYFARVAGKSNRAMTTYRACRLCPPFCSRVNAVWTRRELTNLARLFDRKNPFRSVTRRSITAVIASAFKSGSHSNRRHWIRFFVRANEKRRQSHCVFSVRIPRLPRGKSTFALWAFYVPRSND